MEKHLDITRARLRSFLGRGTLQALLYPERIPLQLEAVSSLRRLPYREAVKGPWHPVEVGQQLGPLWSTHWFRLRIKIPAAWRGAAVHLRWDSSSEACVWSKGIPLQGLTGSGVVGGTGNSIRTDFEIIDTAKGGDSRVLYVEVACNQMVLTDASSETIGKIRLAEIARFDRRVWDLLWDLMVITEMALDLPQGQPRAAQALYTANAMLNVIDPDQPQSWDEARKIAAPFLAARNGDGQHRIHAIGHAHLDTAWRWPLAETKRKCYRTFSNALRNMERYPEFCFTSSSAQHYEWLRVEQPALYREVLQRIKEQRFFPTGGTWIEPDCNLPSGESLVRQFLLGQRFFRAQFGRYCTEFWNPDVFGYCGQLPQIMRGAGIRHFFTQKLNFNQFNKPQRHTFWWQGIDGSRVMTHFPPADSYGGVCTVAQLDYSVRNYKDLERSNHSLYPFGFGDGGGGPTAGMIERLRRAVDTDGLPKVQYSSPATALAAIEDDARDLTTHVGEMYFEEHRGTYTTQAENKRLNRLMEVLLHDVELLQAVGTGKVNAARMESLWRTVLLNQFHDIITGCSLREVHEQSWQQYADCIEVGGGMLDGLLGALAPRQGKNLLTVNTLDRPRREVVDPPPGFDGPVVVTAPAMGYSVAPPQAQVDDEAVVTAKGKRIVIENGYLQAIFKQDGSLISLTDKAVGRQLMAEPGNRFVIFDDRPFCYLAWNVDVYHRETRRECPGATSWQVVEAGPLRATVEFEYQITPTSTLRQQVILTATAPYLEFSCEVDWHECEKFLKVEFPTNLNADYATYEVQFGQVRRPTHFNTPYDLAQFEVCAHRWADLSETNHGVALLNDCKYGHSIHGGTLSLSLLRAPLDPDPMADCGHHRFRYALLPHPGTPGQAGVTHFARCFNSPLHLRSSSAAAGELSWFKVDGDEIIIDTVKRAEDSDAIIVRLYESSGCRCSTTLHAAATISSAARCNLLEEDDQPIRHSKHTVQLELKAFEIVTLKLRLGD